MPNRTLRTAAIAAALSAATSGLIAGSAQAADITPIPIPSAYASITPIPIPSQYASITPIPIPYVALTPYPGQRGLPVRNAPGTGPRPLVR